MSCKYEKTYICISGTILQPSLILNKNEMLKLLQSRYFWLTVWYILSIYKLLKSLSSIEIIFSGNFINGNTVYNFVNRLTEMRNYYTTVASFCILKRFLISVGSGKRSYFQISMLFFTKFNNKLSIQRTDRQHTAETIRV